MGTGVWVEKSAVCNGNNLEVRESASQEEVLGLKERRQATWQNVNPNERKANRFYELAGKKPKLQGLASPSHY